MDELERAMAATKALTAADPGALRCGPRLCVGACMCLRARERLRMTTTVYGKCIVCFHVRLCDAAMTAVQCAPMLRPYAFWRRAMARYGMVTNTTALAQRWSATWRR